MTDTIRQRVDGANVLILGGTGSLGQRLLARIVGGEFGAPRTVTVFSRDEAKQHEMRLQLLQMATATDDVIYRGNTGRVRFDIGDVRRYDELKRSVDRADLIIHAAALKQVPTCEYFGAAAVDTNIYGAINLARAIREGPRHQRTVIGVSTDKACKPVNLMGMTKAIQERILAQANLESDWCRFVSVRYGNVMASRGSAIPFFVDCVRRGRPIPITDRRMTRFLMTLDQSVDLVMDACRLARPGETFLPVVPSGKVVDIARGVAGDPDYPLELTGIRPGEKVHEILVSEEEIARTERREHNLVIQPILPELVGAPPAAFLSGEYSSADENLPADGVRDLLRRHKLTADTAPAASAAAI